MSDLSTDRAGRLIAWPIFFPLPTPETRSVWRALAALGKLREESGDPVQALANYQRSLGFNRNQPEVAARVAALQAVGIGAPNYASPGDGRSSHLPPARRVEGR